MLPLSSLRSVPTIPRLAPASSAVADPHAAVPSDVAEINRPVLDERHWPAVAAAATLTTAAVGFALGGAGGALGAVGLLAAGAGVLTAGLAASIVREGKRDHKRPADCIIVLGTSPGPALTARTRHAEQLLREGVAPAIILTGGMGGPGHTESDAALDVARADGIPASALFQESRSENTWQNFENAREIMRAHGWTSAVISTDPFHQQRSVHIARELGIDAVGSPAAESPHHGVADLARECVSTLKYWNYRLRREL